MTMACQYNRTYKEEKMKGEFIPSIRSYVTDALASLQCCHCQFDEIREVRFWSEF